LTKLHNDERPSVKAADLLTMSYWHLHVRTVRNFVSYRSTIDQG